LVLQTACTYEAATNVNPARNIYSNYDEKLPLKIALYVDAEDMAQRVKVSGYACLAHVYPLDARQAFVTSAVATFENIVSAVTTVSEPLSSAQLQARGLDAMVIVEVQDLDIDLTVIPGFWSAEMKADAEITASIKADTSFGRALGTSVEGSENYTADAGVACEGGAVAIGRATEDAMQETLERLGERLTNSRRLREIRIKD